MDYAAIFGLVQKGLSIVNALVEAGHTAGPAIKAVSDLVAAAKGGKITAEKLDETEALLDSMIEDFNLDLPDA